MTGWPILGTAVALPALAVVILVALYNRLVALRNRCRNAFSQIDVQLQRRHELIPKLVETARGYLAHEHATLEAVVAARAHAAAVGRAGASGPGAEPAVTELAAAETSLGVALGQLLMVVERYPTLRADRTMAQLSEDLSATENRIAFARQAYNDAVMRYNTAREAVPATWVAPRLGFAPAAYFRLETSRDAAAPSAAIG